MHHLSLIKNKYLAEIFTWSCRVLCAIQAFTGISRTMTPMPANTDGPKICHKKKSDTQIWNGPDQIVWKYVIRSMKRCASTDIRLTISPTVDVFLAEFDITRVCKENTWEMWNVKTKWAENPSFSPLKLTHQNQISKDLRRVSVKESGP